MAKKVDLKRAPVDEDEDLPIEASDDQVEQATEEVKAEAAAAPPAPPAIEENTTHKLVMHAGKKMMFETKHSNEAIKAHMAKTFPDVASSDIAVDKHVVEGVRYTRIQFNKRAGTKGMDVEGVRPLHQVLVTVLDRVPRGKLEVIKRGENIMLKFQQGELYMSHLTTEILAEIRRIQRAEQLAAQAQGRARLWIEIEGLPVEDSSLPAGW